MEVAESSKEPDIHFRIANQTAYSDEPAVIISDDIKRSGKEDMEDGIVRNMTPTILSKSQIQLSEDELKGNDKEALLYGLEDVPPWYISLCLGIQHNFQMIVSAVAIPFILTPALCMEDDDPNKATIISTMIFVSGIITILQTTFGSTLPIVQGATVSHLVPALALMNLPKWKCPADLADFSSEDKTEEWQVRMREIQGAVIIASLFEIFLGLSGCIGLLTRYVTPITVAPAITLIGLSLFKSAVTECAKNYYVAVPMVVLLIIFSQHLRNFRVPFPCRKGARFPLFQVFPVLLSIIIIWSICGVLTAFDLIPEGNAARVDAKKRIIEEAAWFYFPYPFQFGWPTFSIGAILGMMCGVLTSTIESIGDYYCCASIIKVPAPPKHAMNRGIFMEGFGCLLSGIFGTGNAATSYSDNIGMLGVTKVGSRMVIQIAGVAMILFGLFGKAGAVFISLPDPILGGMFVFLFPLVMSVGIGTLKNVSLESSRNVFILSFSIFFGLAVSQWMGDHSEDINTGSYELDTFLQVLLSTGMFIAGFTAFILDNTIPGTDEERGIARRDRIDDMVTVSRDKTYDLPVGMKTIEKYPVFKWIPISPTYAKHPLSVLTDKITAKKFRLPTYKRKSNSRSTSTSSDIKTNEI